jgi:hypothetical protein
MKRKYSPIRTPIRREWAEEYLLVTLLSFAVSVSFTRFYLFITGYPQIGRGELHIAHVLWGGLLLFVAAMLPLILSNRWVYGTSAVISGLGVGLFIDEVGKFITRSNDYFYPWAAPIIYVFFLVIVLLYIRLRRSKRRDFRTDLYHILEDLQEVLDHDLSISERDDIIQHLERVKRSSGNKDLVDFASHIEEFITSQSLTVVPDETTFWQKGIHILREIEQKWMNRMRYRAVLAGTLSAIAIWSLYYPIYILTNVLRVHRLEPILLDLLTNQVIHSPTGATWYSAMLMLQILTGIGLLMGAVLEAMGRDRKAYPFYYFTLLFSLTVVNILIFYFDQFSTIINSTVQFLALMIAIRYRSLYLLTKSK